MRVYFYSYAEPGSHTVFILTNTTSFGVFQSSQVQESFEVIALSVFPDPVVSDQTFTVSMSVFNPGETSTEDLEVFIDSILVSSQSIVIQRNSTITWEIDFMLDLEAGSHILMLGDFHTLFNVEIKSSHESTLLLLGLAVVIIISVLIIEKKTGAVSGLF